MMLMSNADGSTCPYGLLISVSGVGIYVVPMEGCLGQSRRK